MNSNEKGKLLEDEVEAQLSKLRGTYPHRVSFQAQPTIFLQTGELQSILNKVLLEE